MTNECDILHDEIVKCLTGKGDVYEAVERFNHMFSTIADSALSQRYVRVELINGTQRFVRNKIEEKYGFHTEWHGTPGFCGIITVFVPKEKCTKALLNEFKRYDKLLGASYGDEPRKYETID